MKCFQKWNCEIEYTICYHQLAVFVFLFFIVRAQANIEVPYQPSADEIKIVNTNSELVWNHCDSHRYQHPSQHR